jgi:ferritin-like metal-binding protein YciE
MQQSINRYLEDAIAAEKSFETQLRGFAKDATFDEARNLFEQHAVETKRQYEVLTARLEALGGSTSTLKSLLAHLFNSAPKMAQLGHENEERTAQNLIMAFAVENAEVAMYEALVIAAETVGDDVTADLARRIQAEERATAEKVWSVIAPSALEGAQAAAEVQIQDAEGSDRVDSVDMDAVEGSRQVVIRYLQDAEAAERNFEDALASFSKAGEQPRVQELMSVLSEKAKTQHTRLRQRLEQLGGSPSSSKSLVAHLLAFTPLTAQMGHDDAEKSTQHLMITYAAAAAERAMYEALIVAAEEVDDEETAELARELQEEEEEDQRLAWAQLAPSARESLQAVLSHSD